MAIPQENLKRMLECPICLGTLKNAKMLQCVHFFCNNCLEGTRTEHQFTCSVCRQVTRSQNVGNVPVVNDILEALNSPLKNGASCTMCKKDTSKYRCTDCKATYCPDCKDKHDEIPICQQHISVEIEDDETDLVVDKLVFCPTHKRQGLRA